MNGVWSKKWKNCLLWFSAYFSFVAFALFGGYVILKDEDEELKKTTKIAFIVTMIFAAISGFLSVFYNFASMADNFYSSVVYDIYNILTSIVNVGKIVTFAVFIILELTKKEKNLAQTQE